MTYNGLDNGTHTFSVKSIDQAGHGSAPSTYTWRIITPFKKIAAGHIHPVALKADKTLWVWGSSNLGYGTTAEKLFPVKIGAATDWVSVAAGDQHTVALQADGTVWVWGYDLLGDGTIPAKIGADTDWVSVGSPALIIP